MWKNFKDRPSYVNQTRYKMRSNEVCNEIRAAKKSFEYRLAQNIKEDPKTFYAMLDQVVNLGVELGR